MSDLRAERLECIRGDDLVLADVSLALSGPGVLQITGANGSGKTTLLRMLAGFLRPESGRVTFDGLDVFESHHRLEGAIAYLGHRRGVSSDLTAAENVRIAAALSGRDCGPAILAPLLDRVGLGGAAETPARLLSAGQNQRVALARIAVSDARLWILDEPLTALDQAGKTLLERIIADHVAGGGMVVCATHQALALPDCPAFQHRLDAARPA